MRRVRTWDFELWHITGKESFKNYVDQFLSYFDHLPTYRGLSWTFGAPPTPCPRGHIKTWPPPPYVQNAPSFTSFTEKKKLSYNCQVFSGLLSNPINIHKQKISDIIVNKMTTYQANTLQNDCYLLKNVMKWQFTKKKLYKMTVYQAKTL